MKLNDNEKQYLKTTMLVQGNKEYKTDFFESTSFDSLRDSMIHGLPSVNDQRLKYDFCDKDEILLAGRYVIDKHFGNIDTRVRYTDGDNLESQLVARFGLTPDKSQYKDIIKYINDHVQLVKVTDIPLYLSTEDDQNGQTQNTHFYGPDVMDKRFFKKLPNCLREIIITGNCDENSKMIYVHEMSHALLNNNKGSFTNVLNVESLPIFMEKVAALDLDNTGRLLDLKTLSRLLDVKFEILDNEILEYVENKPLEVLRNQGYIISSLHATALFDLYQKSSQRTKDAIDSSLGDVITGSSTMEDVFDYYEATCEKGAKIMRRQIKSFSK